MIENSKLKIENSSARPRLIDAHTHVQFAAYKDDTEEVIKRALAENIWLVNVGTQKDTSARAVEIAEKYDKGVYATVGIHPIHTEESFHDAQELGSGEAAQEFSSRGEVFDYDFYKNLGKNKKVVAIGECGLDYYRLGENTKKSQEKVFLEQIQLASELKKPLMIHCRQAYPDLIKILTTYYQLLTTPAGIIHFFSGTKEDAEKLLNMNFYFTFGGVITFVRDYDEVIKYIPLNRILSETDAPYVTPVPHRGKRNEPTYVRYVVEKLAEIKGISLEKATEQIWENAQKVIFSNL